MSQFLIPFYWDKLPLFIGTFPLFWGLFAPFNWVKMRLLEVIFKPCVTIKKEVVVEEFIALYILR